jgi:hypothetical protein
MIVHDSSHGSCCKTSNDRGPILHAPAVRLRPPLAWWNAGAAASSEEEGANRLAHGNGFLERVYDSARRLGFRQKVGWSVSSRRGALHYFRDLSFGDFRRRTPGPPPFSSMNSTPAASRARRLSRRSEVKMACESRSRFSSINQTPSRCRLCNPIRLHEEIDDAIRIIYPDHDTILVAGDIENRSTVVESAGAANRSLDIRRRCPVSRPDLPVPSHQWLARVSVRGA